MIDKRKLKVFDMQKVFFYANEECPVVVDSCNECEEESGPLDSCPEVPVEVCGNCSEASPDTFCPIMFYCS